MTLRRRGALVKILGRGELGKALSVKAHKFSESAVKKIAAAGGAAEVIGQSGLEAGDGPR